MLRFSLFGIPVQIQPWFWFTLGLIGMFITNPTDGTGMTALLLFVLAGFLSIMVHELGHALAGRMFNAPTAITLQAFGGFASFPANAFTRGQDFVVTGAGPAVQLVLGFATLVLANALPINGGYGVLFAHFLIIISIFWALLNLVPVYPLDGGRLVLALLGPARRRLALKISMATAIVVGLFLFLRSGMFIFPIFLGLMAHQNWEELKGYGY